MLPYSSYSPLQLQQALNFQQSQMLDRMRFAFPGLAPPNFPGFGPLDGGLPPPGTPGFGFSPFDPRMARFIQEEPKPQHSYIGLIAMAILSSADKKLVLSDIYQWILDNYPYFRTRGPGWRNSIRHNLSLNDCFIKAGRSANGKGHYWAIHPANVEDFKKGDFRRRRAQRKVRKAMGLSVPDDEDEDDYSPCDSPHHMGLLPRVVAPGLAEHPGLGFTVSDLTAHFHDSPNSSSDDQLSPLSEIVDSLKVAVDHPFLASSKRCFPGNSEKQLLQNNKRRRLFDVESLLAPEADELEAETNQKRLKLEHQEQSSDNDYKEQQTAKHNSMQALMAAAGLKSGGGLPFPTLFGAGAPGHLPFYPNGLIHNGAGLTVPPFPWNMALAFPLKFGGGSGPINNEGHIQKPWPTTGDDGATEMSNSKEEPRSPSPNQNSAARWQETFAKILARSYQGKQTLPGAAVTTSNSSNKPVDECCAITTSVPSITTA